VTLEDLEGFITTVVTIPSTLPVTAEILIRLPEDPQLEIVAHSQRIRNMLIDFQTEMALKDKIWATVSTKKSVSSKIGEIMSLEHDEAVTGPICELLLADSRQGDLSH
jgi:hypothetical protein